MDINEWAATRRPVWAAISELFLDVGLSDTALADISRRLKDSGLSEAQLYEIYADEVAPVLYRNLASPAGEWAGFDLQWLEGKITGNQKRGSELRQAMLFKPLRRYWVTRSTIAEWRKVVVGMSEVGSR